MLSNCLMRKVISSPVSSSASNLDLQGTGHRVLGAVSWGLSPGLLSQGKGLMLPLKENECRQGPAPQVAAQLQSCDTRCQAQASTQPVTVQLSPVLR